MHPLHFPIGKRIRTCLRINAKDVKAYSNRIKSLGVKFDYQGHEWGTVVKFFDPYGNCVHSLIV